MNFLKKLFLGWNGFFLLSFGCFILAMGINLFTLPTKLTPGGLTGLVTILYYLSGEKINVGITMFLFNIPLLIFSFKYLGKLFVLRTLYSTFLNSFFIDITQPFTNNFVHKYLLSDTSSPEANLLLYTIFGGAFIGIGLGMVFKAEGTTGGTDLIARLIYVFKPNMTLGKLLLFIDSLIIISGIIAFKSVLIGLYSTVALFVISKIIDAILEGVNFTKSFTIISNKSEIISKRILQDVSRGATILRGIGVYTKEEKNIILCVVDRAQIQTLRRVINEEDPHAFVIMSDVREVLGEGFKKL